MSESQEFKLFVRLKGIKLSKLRYILKIKEEYYGLSEYKYNKLRGLVCK